MPKYIFPTQLFIELRLVFLSVAVQFYCICSQLLNSHIQNMDIILRNVPITTTILFQSKCLQFLYDLNFFRSLNRFCFLEISKLEQRIRSRESSRGKFEISLPCEFFFSGKGLRT